MSAVEGRPELRGRVPLVHAVTAELMAPEPMGVVLVGEPGIGKTAVARRVSEELQQSVGVLPVRGAAGLRSVPYGALSHYLDEVALTDIGSPAAILRHFLKHVMRAGKAHTPPVILIDDMHNLDDESALLIMQLATARKVKVLATAREVPGLAGEFARGVKDGLLTQRLVEPLTLPDVQELCAQVLGGPILTGTARLLAETTRGNPLFLTMLLNQGSTQGYLVEENGVWRARGARPALDAPLTDLILDGLGERTDAELRAIEYMAVSGPVPFSSLEPGVSRGDLARLIREHLIEIDPVGEQLITLKHPLHGEAIRGRIPAPRALELTESALASVSASSDTLRDVTSRVARALAVSQPVDDSVLLRAARIANRLHDPTLALRVLEAVRAPAPTPAYLLEVAWAQWGHRNYELARALVDEALRGATDDGIARDGRLLSLLMRLREGTSVSGTQDDVERWSDLLVALAEDGDTETSVGSVRGGPRAAAEPGLVRPDPGLPDEVQVGHLSVLAHALTRAGRLRAGTEALADAGGLLERNLEPLLAYRDLLTGEHLLALMGRGLWDQARELFHSTYPVDTESTYLLSGWLDFIDGSMGLRAGGYGDARQRLILAVEAFRETDELHILDWIRGVAAYACAMAGDAAGAGALIGERGAWHENSDVVAHLMGGIFSTAALGHLGEQDAVSRLRSTARRAENRGLQLVAATALEHAVILGDRSALHPLAEVTREFDGEEGSMLHGFAVAAATRDRGALMVGSDTARERGYLPLAIKSLEEAASIGPPGAAARSIERRLSGLRADLRVLSGGAAATQAPGTRLTRGEQAIVKLVAAGHTNREIGELQGISTRTVEGHLYRIFAKLGISKREALQRSDANALP